MEFKFTYSYYIHTYIIDTYIIDTFFAYISAPRHFDHPLRDRSRMMNDGDKSRAN